MKSKLAVRNVAWHGDGIYELMLERGDVEFAPGDCVAISRGDDEATSRPYSIASGTEEDCLRFLIRRIDGGQVSDDLCRLAAGERVMVSAPFGWFRPGDAAAAAQPFVYVATGTGIAPFLSSLRSAPTARPRTLLWGVREHADAVALDWLRERCDDLALAVSREDPDGGAHHGRVTDLLDRLPREPGCHYYLCGLDAMIEELTRWLTGHGVSARRIHRESFFNAAGQANAA